MKKYPIFNLPLLLPLLYLPQTSAKCFTRPLKEIMPRFE